MNEICPHLATYAVVWQARAGESPSCDLTTTVGNLFVCLCVNSKLYWYVNIYIYIYIYICVCDIALFIVFIYVVYNLLQSDSCSDFFLYITIVFDSPLYLCLVSFQIYWTLTSILAWKHSEQFCRLFLHVFVCVCWFCARFYVFLSLWGVLLFHLFVFVCLFFYLLLMLLRF